MKKENKLENLLEFYMNSLNEMLCEHKGEWVVFKEKNPLGFYKSEIEAYLAGRKKYGNVPMLIREVSDEYIKYGKYGKPQRIYNNALFN